MVLHGAAPHGVISRNTMEILAGCYSWEAVWMQPFDPVRTIQRTGPYKRFFPARRAQTVEWTDGVGTARDSRLRLSSV